MKYKIGNKVNVIGELNKSKTITEIIEFIDKSGCLYKLSDRNYPIWEKLLILDEREINEE